MQATTASVLRAAGHPLRISILELLNTNGETSVNTIVSKLNTDQSLTSHHLKLLTQAGFIKSKRQGKQILYAIASKKLYSLLEIVKTELKHD